MLAVYVCVFEVCPDGLLEDRHNPGEPPEFVQCAVCVCVCIHPHPCVHACVHMINSECTVRVCECVSVSQ